MVWGGTSKLEKLSGESEEEFQARCREQQPGETDDEYARRLALIEEAERIDSAIDEVRPMWKAFADTLATLLSEERDEI